jgi:Zn-dependent protease
MTLSSLFQNFVFRAIAALPVLLIALPFHECAHGYTAYLLGDNTAKLSGRLTLNPFRHLDLVGSLGILFLGFGWANPVPVNPWNFKHRKGDMAITALAGPLSNLLLAFVSLFILAACGKLLNTSSTAYMYLTFFMEYFAMLNISLCVFNLIPIPPLDGSRLLAVLLPENAFAAFERFGPVPAMILIFVFWQYISTPISNITSYIFTGFYNFFGL